MAYWMLANFWIEFDPAITGKQVFPVLSMQVEIWNPAWRFISLLNTSTILVKTALDKTLSCRPSFLGFNWYAPGIKSLKNGRCSNVWSWILASLLNIYLFYIYLFAIYYYTIARLAKYVCCQVISAKGNFTLLFLYYKPINMDFELMLFAVNWIFNPPQNNCYSD